MQQNLHSTTPTLAWDTTLDKTIQTYIAANPTGTAIFDADGTLWGDDVGDGFFHWLVSHQHLKSTNGNIINFSHYETLLNINKVDAYRFLVTVMAGLYTEEVSALAATYFKEKIAHKLYQPQLALIQQLKTSGYDVWIVSASNQWVVEAGAEYFGIHPANVIGIGTHLNNGVLTDQIIEPMSYAEGKVVCIKNIIKKIPNIVCGDSIADFPMLQYSSGLKIYIDHQQNDEVRNAAMLQNFHVQYFPYESSVQLTFKH